MKLFAGGQRLRRNMKKYMIKKYMKGYNKHDKVIIIAYKSDKKKHQQ
jgi:hypothetical protein